MRLKYFATLMLMLLSCSCIINSDITNGSKNVNSDVTNGNKAINGEITDGNKIVIHKTVNLNQTPTRPLFPEENNPNENTTNAQPNGLTNTEQTQQTNENDGSVDTDTIPPNNLYTKYLAKDCYTYGDRESLLDAKRYALILAQEKALKFIYSSRIESHQELSNRELTDDQLSSLSKGCLKGLKFDYDVDKRKVCCIIKSAEIDKECINLSNKDDLPIFINVPSGNYKTPQFLSHHVYHFYYESSSVTIDYDFKIMERELSVKQFSKYYMTLTDYQKNKLGDDWKKNDESAPVENIPYEFVQGYISWFSQQLGQPVRLPSIKEWIATCVCYYSEINYYKFEPVIDQKQAISKVRRSPDHLLGNLREWSRSPCDEDKHYYLLGGNYISNKIASKEAYCASENDRYLGGVGIRLVIIPSHLAYNDREKRF